MACVLVKICVLVRDGNNSVVYMWRQRDPKALAVETGHNRGSQSQGRPAEDPSSRLLLLASTKSFETQSLRPNHTVQRVMLGCIWMGLLLKPIKYETQLCCELIAM